MRYSVAALGAIAISFSLRSTPAHYSAFMMTKTISLTLAMFLSVSALTVPAAAGARRDGPADDQGNVRADVQRGKVKSLREIESAVLPRMGGMQYLGPEYDSIAQVYRLKFIEDGRVRFVDVDAKTGKVIRQR